MLKNSKLEGNNSKMRSPEDEAQDGNWNHGGHYVRRLDFIQKVWGTRDLWAE